MSFGANRTSGFGGKSSSSRSGQGRPRQQPRRFTPRVVVDPDAPVVPLTEEQVAKSRKRAMNICLWHLEQMPKTRKELSDKLVSKDIRADIVEATLDRLEDLGYVNDVAYAKEFVRSRHENRKQGSNAIKFALRNKGVDADLVTDALEAVDPDAEYANAVDLVTRKMLTTRGLDRTKRTNRLVGMLARKGYNAGVVYQVVREALDAEVPEDPVLGI